MNSFWERIYDAVKDRNYGMLFFGTFLGMIIAFFLIGLLVAITGVNGVQTYLMPVLGGMAFFAVIAMAVTIRRARRQRAKRRKFMELSRDEIQKARSKLMRSKLKL